MSNSIAHAIFNRAFSKMIFFIRNRSSSTAITLKLSGYFLFFKGKFEAERPGYDFNKGLQSEMIKF